MFYSIKRFLAFEIDGFLKSNFSEVLDSSNSLESKTLLSANDITLNYPKDKTHGHLATTICFVLANKIRNLKAYSKDLNPKDLSVKIATFLNSKDSHFFEKITALNGFLNLTLSLSFLESRAMKSLDNPLNFLDSKDSEYAIESKLQQKILLEYVSANPTGPLHIGHARGAIFGSAFQNIGNFLGDKITGEYYVNDAGSQIDMLSLSLYQAVLKELDLESKSKKSEENSDNVLHETFENLDLVKASSQKTTESTQEETQEDSQSQEYLQETPQVYKGEYITDIAKKAISYFGEIFFTSEYENIREKLGSFGKEKMLCEIKHNLKSARIHMDNFVSEKELYKDWGQTLESLRRHRALKNDGGAVWLRSSEKGDDKDRVLVRQSGEPTYMAGDIIYHKNKFERGFDKCINIWGADHHGYIKRMEASVDFLGFDSKNLEVLLVQIVNLSKDGKPYKMSKRAGNFILMQDVVDDIGVDNLRFIFLAKSLDTHLEFDIEDLNKQDASNPIFYINYANARIHTLLEKSRFKENEILESSLESLRDSKDLALEISHLIFNALSLGQILETAYNTRELHKICDYLKNLAKLLHSFYNAYRILNTTHEREILKALKIISLSFTTAFTLMGIEIKTKM